MRVYLPATGRDLMSDVLSARLAHAATQSLAEALPEEDEEGLEVSATLCAADDSVILLSQDPDIPARRIVIAADVDSSAVEDVTARVDGEEVLPGTVRVNIDISWDDVAALLVDEAEAAAEIRAAARGDEEAFERVADLDLLWFDVSERAALARELGC